MTGDIPSHNWTESIKSAHKHNVPISLDFNHRPQLGPIEKLWEIVKPILKFLDILILSHDSIQGLSKLFGVHKEDLSTKQLLLALHNVIGVKLAYCDKHREVKIVDGKQQEVQIRFSVLALNGALKSTEEIPVCHIPKDECGGGSAWAAGYIASMMEIKSKGGDEGSIDWISVLRRADLLAALCQETVGDHSIVKATTLLNFEQKYSNKVADISSNEIVKQVHCQHESSDQILQNVLKALKETKVVPILRAKNTQLTIERGLELIDLGCTALEITLDTPGIIDILKEIRKNITSSGKKCWLGVGTILDKSQLASVVGIVDFAISPVNPPGFIEECHKHNILAIPGACSPQELWNTKLQGALAVKLFPSQLWSPAALKEVLNVGPLGELNVMATGGITPEKYPEWLAAGAVTVGMGSRLCGNDLKFAYDDPQFKKEHQNWKEQGVKVATELFAKLKK
jgi:Entner-Doudoroff aldolase